MNRSPYAISHSISDKDKSSRDVKRDISWKFGWTNSKHDHEVQFNFDDISGKKVVKYDGKDIYNEITKEKGLSLSWETKKGHLMHIEAIDTVVFSIDGIPFNQFLFPKPKWKDDLQSLEDSDEEITDEENQSVLSKYADLAALDDDSPSPKYTFFIEVVEPIVPKNEHYVTYTVNAHCNDPSWPQLLNCSVSRRYSDFGFLHDQLCDESAFRGLFIPPLPSKQTIGRFDPHFLEERRSALSSFLCRLRDHDEFHKSLHFHDFLSLTSSQFQMKKKAFYQEREGLRSSLSGWFGHAMHSLAKTVRRSESVTLGFNPLDLQAQEIDRYIAQLSEGVHRVDRSVRRLVEVQKSRCQGASMWGTAMCKLGEIPPGPSTLDINITSLSQVLELDDDKDRSDRLSDGYEEIESFSDIYGIKPVGASEKREVFVRPHQFPAGMSDLTGEETITATDLLEPSSNAPSHGQVDVGDTLTTVEETECSAWLDRLGRTAENMSKLEHDLACAHEIEVCRRLEEYIRIIASIKRSLQLRNEFKQTFTDSIEVKLEKYQQYVAAVEACVDTKKVAAKLAAYNEAKEVMLENRKIHIQVTKNVIADFQRFMRSKDKDFKAIAVNVLTFNILHCQDNIDNWTNALETFKIGIEKA